MGSITGCSDSDSETADSGATDGSVSSDATAGDGTVSDASGQNDAQVSDATVLETCEEGCAWIAECHGFADEAFGKDEAECRAGCEEEEPATIAAIFDCLVAAGCDDDDAIFACAPE